MKKILIVASLAAFASCNSSNDNKAKVESMGPSSDSSSASTSTVTSTTMADINSPYAVSYSSKFAMGDPKNAEAILTLWKDWDNGDLAAHKDLFADSVELHFYDGTMLHASRDSVVAAAQKVRGSFATSVSSVDAVTALRSTDKNENWALVWGKEIDTDKKGKVDSFYLQETWGFNKDGKTDKLYQFRAAAKPAKK